MIENHSTYFQLWFIFHILPLTLVDIIIIAIDFQCTSRTKWHEKFERSVLRLSIYSDWTKSSIHSFLLSLSLFGIHGHHLFNNERVQLKTHYNFFHWNYVPFLLLSMCDFFDVKLNMCYMVPEFRSLCHCWMLCDWVDHAFKVIRRRTIYVIFSKCDY